MYKQFTQKEAWEYVIQNIYFIKYRLYFKNITFNTEDILQDTIILLFEKLTNKAFEINNTGSIVHFRTIADNAIIDVLRVNYKFVDKEYPAEEIISHDRVCV